MVFIVVVFFFYLFFFLSNIFSFLTGLSSLLGPLGFWHLALPVGVCSLECNNNNNNNNNNDRKKTAKLPLVVTVCLRFWLVLAKSFIIYIDDDIFRLDIYISTHGYTVYISIELKQINNIHIYCTYIHIYIYTHTYIHTCTVLEWMRHHLFLILFLF